MTEWQLDMVSKVKQGGGSCKAIGQYYVVGRVFDIRTGKHLFVLRSVDGYAVDMKGWDEHKDIRPAIKAIKRARFERYQEHKLQRTNHGFWYGKKRTEKGGGHDV